METYMPLLKNTNMFLGIRDSEIRTMLKCLSTKKIRFQKGEYIIRSGENNHLVGLVLSGLVLIEKADHWGNNSIFEEITPGMTFAESLVNDRIFGEFSLSVPPPASITRS